MTVHEEIIDQVLVVTLDRPETRNAVDRPTSEALANAFARFDTDDSIAAAVLLLVAARTDALRTALRHWRLVLRNEFHDILPGSSIREVYQDAESELGSAINAGRVRIWALNSFNSFMGLF